MLIRDSALREDHFVFVPDAIATVGQRRFLDEQENEIRRINARFDDELVRLDSLWLAQARSRPATARK